MNNSIVVLTGAGISSESGLSTFRDQNGLWDNHAIEDVASFEGFERNPDLVQSFYNARRAQLLAPEVQPNAAHLALAKLEEHWPGTVLIVTQNVDDLHERAGSRNLIHMHGELLKARCFVSHQIFPWHTDITRDSTCPCCLQTRILRPHIVWFGEVPLEMNRIYEALETCSEFIAIGTSGHVYPAAGFVAAVTPNCKTAELNVDATAISPFFKTQVVGPASIEVPKFIENLLQKHGQKHGQKS